MTTSVVCIYIRGDANVNIKNIDRVNIFNSFKNHLDLIETKTAHKTYHHFVGGGLFDSNVDVILQSKGSFEPAEVESITGILCKNEFPELNSHHDVILSLFSLPPGNPDTISADLITAPRLDHHRTNITWTEEGIQKYSALVSSHLERLRSTLVNPKCQASMSILLQLTNTVMSKAATATNEFKLLSQKRTPRKKRIPQTIQKAQNKLNKAHRKLKSSPGPATQHQLRKSRKSLHHAVRTHNMQCDLDRDRQLYNIMGENPSKVFSLIKSFKNTQHGAIAKLTVGQKTYHGQQVADGFYESMSSLKQCDPESLKSVPELSEKLLDYNTIIKLCQNHQGMPAIAMDKSNELLLKIKKNVKDHYSITSQHYLNAGQEGLQHFNALLNGIISDINNAGLDEMNTAHGLIFYKGHCKDKTSDWSYRTISTCPLLAKSLDMYIRDLYLDLWQDQEADTQYQGTGSSHELASLLLTEVIQHSLYVDSQPVYLLALDAQSAFDRCLRQVLTSELYKANMPPAAILVIDKRLESRSTVYEWEGAVMGPAKDKTGFEQGGVNSSDFYKLYNNEQLKTAQESELGVDIGSGVISAIGQADDVMLAALSLHNLQMLVTLTEQYCAKFRVKLEPSKTKLLVYCPPKQSFLVDHALNCHQITINNTPVKLVTEAEHVGVLRNTAGNLPHIVNRIAMHKNSLHALLPAGLARRHRGNPAAALRLGQLYGTPVLLSGLASLVLSQAELKILDGHYLLTLQNLLRLHDRTPRSMVYFLAGSLPATAILHQRQMSLFSMICHLKNDPLNLHAQYVILHSKKCSKSWFIQVRDICLQYGLPHPLKLLESPPTMQRLKCLVKTKITEYWQHLLASEALTKPSLSHFNPLMHCVVSPHPVWTTAGSSAFEVNKATILARMISGRYRTDSLCRFWSDTRQGYCLAETCDQIVGDLEHLLLHCPALHEVRQNLQQMWLERAAVLPPLQTIVAQVIASTPTMKMKFTLDPTLMPDIICLLQTYGKGVLDIVFYMSRTYAYGLHRKRLILIGKWPYATKDENCTNVGQLNSAIVAGISTRGPGVSDGPTTTSRCQENSQHSQSSPNSTSTDNNARPLTHTMQNLLCEGPRVALPHHSYPEHVHVPAKHGLPVDSGGRAGGDCGLNGGDAYGTMLDSLSLPPPENITKSS